MMKNINECLKEWNILLNKKKKNFKNFVKIRINSDDDLPSGRKNIKHTKRGNIY